MELFTVSLAALVVTCVAVWYCCIFYSNMKRETENTRLAQLSALEFATVCKLMDELHYLKSNAKDSNQTKELEVSLLSDIEKHYSSGAEYIEQLYQRTESQTFFDTSIFKKPLNITEEREV